MRRGLAPAGLGQRALRDRRRPMSRLPALAWRTTKMLTARRTYTGSRSRPVPSWSDEGGRARLRQAVEGDVDQIADLLEARGESRMPSTCGWSSSDIGLDGVAVVVDGDACRVHRRAARRDAARAPSRRSDRAGRPARSSWWPRTRSTRVGARPCPDGVGARAVGGRPRPPDHDRDPVLLPAVRYEYAIDIAPARRLTRAAGADAVRCRSRRLRRRRAGDRSSAGRRSGDPPSDDAALSCGVAMGARRTSRRRPGWPSATASVVATVGRRR